MLLVMSVVVSMAMVMVVMVMIVIVVSVICVSVRVAMPAEHYEADEVGKQAGTSNDEYELRVADVGGFDESSDGFENDGNAESDEEDGVEEGAENLGPNPLEAEKLSVHSEDISESGSTHTKGELVSGGLLRRYYSPQSNNERYNIVQLVLVVRVV